MRDIRFRIWDMKHENFCYMSWSYIDGKDNNGRYMYVGEIEKLNYSSIQEYIGKKDKNVTEIYEGDILNTPSGTKYVVRFSNGGFCWCLLKDEKVKFWFSDSHPDFEVIGNIHQNPELLE